MVSATHFKLIYGARAVLYGKIFNKSIFGARAVVYGKIRNKKLFCEPTSAVWGVPPE